MRSMRRPGSPRPACSWSGRPEATAIHSRWRSSTGSLSSPPTSRPVSQRAAAPHLAGARRLRGEGQAVPHPGDRGERDRVHGGAVHGLGEVGEEGLDGARGVGDLLGEQLQAHDLARVRVRGGRHLGGAGEVSGQSRVDQVGGDAAAAQEPAVGLHDAQFAAPGQVAGGRAVRFQTEQGRAPAAYREAGLGVEEGGARCGRALGAGQLGLEGAEAQLRSQDAVAVLVHQGRRFDHPGSPRWDRAPRGSCAVRPARLAVRVPRGFLRS